MTDYTKLIELMRTDSAFDNTTLGNEAADALEAQALQLDVQAGSIEAVQAANQRLAAEVAEHKENAMRNARIAVSIRAERDQLQSKLGDAIQSSAHWQHQCTELQAENERLAHANNALKLAVSGLQSQLDAMGKGEPVAHVYAIERTGRPLVAWDDAKGIGLGDKLYAAPKALAPEPLTDDELWKFWWSRPEVPEGEDESMEAQFVAAARSILAAHGITKGTP